MGYAFDIAVEQARAVVGRDAPDLVIHMTIDREVQQAAAELAIRRRLGNRAFGRRPLQAATSRSTAMAACARWSAAPTTTPRSSTASRKRAASPARRSRRSSTPPRLKRGLDTEDVRYDEPVVIDGWRPRNYDDGYRGAVTLRTAFALSINTVAAEVANEVGPARASPTWRAGSAFATCPSAIAFVPPSIALGSIETTLWDMTTAFATFMNDGMRVDPHIVAARHQLGRPRNSIVRPPYNAARAR